MDTILCVYCDQIKPMPMKDGEHPILEGLGSPIRNKYVCSECNADASKLIDNKYSREPLIRNLVSITGTKSKNKFGDKREIREQKLDIDKTIKIRVEKNKISYLNLTEDKLKRLREKHGDVFQVLNLEEKNIDIIKREHAKMILGIASLCLENFSRTVTADFLRDFMWNGEKADISKYVGKEPNCKFLTNYRESIEFEDTEFPKIMNIHKNHTITIKGNDDGIVDIYIDLYGVHGARIKTLESKQEWKSMRIDIEIDPSTKEITKCKGISKDILLNGLRE